MKKLSGDFPKRDKSISIDFEILADIWVFITSISVPTNIISATSLIIWAFKEER